MDRPYRIAFVTPHMDNSIAWSVWQSLQDKALELGVRLTVVLGGECIDASRRSPSQRILDLVDHRSFDGILLQTGALSDASVASALDWFAGSDRPLQVVSLGVPIDGVTSVGVDQPEAVRTLVHHMAEVHGYGRFAFVEGPPGFAEAEVRKKAFWAAMEELRVPASQISVFSGDYTRESGATALGLLADHYVAPTALLCANDDEAFGALREALRRGVSVPSKIGIAGFDHIVRSPLELLELTTVVQPMVRHAGLALGLLVEAIEGTSPWSHHIEAARVLFTESCGCQHRGCPAQGSTKLELIGEIIASQTNATDGFLAFSREWISDFFTAFEYLLQTGNSSVLKALWVRYMANPALQFEGGVPFRRLFLAAESLFSTHPRLEAAVRENLLLAGDAESRRGVESVEATRQFFFRLNAIEMAISRVSTREGLARFADPGWYLLGILGVVVVRSGSTDEVLYQSTAWSSGDPRDSFVPNAVLELDGPSRNRVVLPMGADGEYLGYIVLWTDPTRVFAFELLANQFAGLIQRIELIERVKSQSESLARSLDEAKRMQEQLVETEKVASLGRLVAGVAHEINTPLGTGITGTSFVLERLEHLKAAYSGGTLARSDMDQFLETGQTALDGVLRNLMKAGELIQAFKGLGLDHGQGEWRPIDLPALFTDLEMVYRTEFTKRDFGLVVQIPPPPLLVYTQASALVQVVGELLENALIHAFSPRGGADPLVVLQVSVEGESLRVAVTDNGRGLDADERRHLFDPLFTTRRPQGHAGLGLHLAHQLVVRTLGGQMTVASEVGQGTCFLCRVPLGPPA